MASRARPRPTPAAASTGAFPIRAVSQATGLSADTLRVWERRYGFPKPSRGEHGVRFFTDTDVERLTLIVRALRWGYRPGEVVAKEAGALKELLDRPFQVPVAEERSPLIPPMLSALKKGDLGIVAAGLRSAVANLGIKAFVAQVVTPLMEEVGDLWSRGELDIRHEHLLTEAVTGRVRTLLSTYSPEEGHPLILLTTLPGETHVLGGQLVALYAAADGVVPRLLGGDTPPAEIVAAATSLRAEVIGISVSGAANPRAVEAGVRKVIHAVELAGTGCEVWLGGRGAWNLGIRGDNLRIVRTWAEADREFARLKARAGLSRG